jgi:gluconolactonase
MRAAEGLMTSRLFLAMGFGISAAAAGLAQAPAQTPPTGINLQAPNDPRYAEVIAKCKTPPPARGGGGGAAGRPGGGPPPGGAAPGAAAGQARGAAAPAAPPDYTVTEIPGVIAAGQRWTSIYQTTGNNGDGPIAADDGALLIAQNDNGVVLKVDVKGQTSPVYRDTNTGGSLAMSTKGALFVASRGINNSILQLAPQRRVFVNSYRGDPLECLGGVINDMTADSRGGVYFTMGGLFYADAKGMATSYGENLRTNGVILSPDEKTLYVTNGQSIAAFEVRPDGSLANQREFAKLPGGGGDGMTVDAAARLYVTAGGGGGGGAAASGVHVFAPDGKHLGQIPSPRNLITAAFSGPDKKTLFAIANDRQRVDVYTIPMIAQGYKGRAK